MFATLFRSFPDNDKETEEYAKNHLRGKLSDAIVDAFKSGLDEFEIAMILIKKACEVLPDKKENES